MLTSGVPSKKATWWLLFQEVHQWSHSCQTGDAVTLKPHETRDTSCVPQMILSDDYLKDIVWPRAVSHYYTPKYMPMVVQAGTGVSRIVLNKVCHRNRVAGYLQQAPAYLPHGLCGNWDPCLPLVSLKLPFTGARLLHIPFFFFFKSQEKARHIHHRF